MMKSAGWKNIAWLVTFLQAIKDNYLTEILVININYKYELSGSKSILSQQRCSQESQACRTSKNNSQQNSR